MKRLLLSFILIAGSLLLTSCPEIFDPASLKNLLSSLNVDHGTLTPDFDPSITAYTLEVENAVESLTVTAEAEDANSVVTLTPGSIVELTVGSNTVTITVTAEDETRLDYTIEVTRQAAEGAVSDKDILDLSFSGIELDGLMRFPQDSDDEVEILGYYVPPATDLGSLTPVITHNGASISPDSGVAQDFSGGMVEYTVTAEDGSTKEYYIVLDTNGELLDDGNIYLYMGGDFTLYGAADFDFVLRAAGGTSDLVSVSPGITEYEGLESVNDVILSSGHGNASGDYDLHVDIDIDGDSNFTDDTGDARTQDAPLVYNLPDTTLPVVFCMELPDIPLLMSDSSKAGLLYLGVENSGDILALSAATPLRIEIYLVNEEDPAPAVAEMVNGNPLYSRDIEDAADLLTIPLAELNDEEFYFGFIYYDENNSGSLDVGEGTEAASFFAFEESLVLAETIYPYETNIGRHSLPAAGRSSLAYTLDIDYEYTGSVPVVDDDTGAWMCFLIADSADPDDWGGDFNDEMNSNVRYYANMGEASNERMLIGEDDAIQYYYVMVLDVDRSESLTDGDLYNTAPVQAVLISETSTQSFSFDDSDMMIYSVPVP